MIAARGFFFWWAVTPTNTCKHCERYLCTLLTQPTSRGKNTKSPEKTISRLSRDRKPPLNGYSTDSGHIYIYIPATGSSFRCRTLWGSSRISRTQHWKLLKLSQSLYHIIILLPFSGKSLTRKWRDARASLVSKCSDPAPPRSRRGLELPPKISSFRCKSYS